MLGVPGLPGLQGITPGGSLQVITIKHAGVAAAAAALFEGWLDGRFGHGIGIGRRCAGARLLKLVRGCHGRVMMPDGGTADARSNPVHDPGKWCRLLVHSPSAMIDEQVAVISRASTAAAGKSAPLSEISE